jgi:hypothetical protein
VPLALGGLDHGEADAVLHGAARVQVLDAADLDEGRVAHQIEHRADDARVIGEGRQAGECLPLVEALCLRDVK